MSIKCKDIIYFMEEIAPVWLAESWDNVGLLLGDSEQPVERILVCLDVTSNIVEYSIENKINMIISHHPLLFEGIKNLSLENPKNRMLYKLIKNDIAVYSAHTNLDAAEGGVNDYLARLLGLQAIRDLKAYKSEKLYKLVVFVPEDHIDIVRNSISQAGAGWIGNYSHCTFSAKGTGTFMPLEGTNPYIGSQGSIEKAAEYRLETVVQDSKLKSVLNAMLKVHPYEEVAYDIFEEKTGQKEFGLGKIGIVEPAATLYELANSVKYKLNAGSVRLIGGNEKDRVEKVAVFCGGFDGDLQSVLKSKADVLITGDIKYHTAAEIVELGMRVIDAGHFNTERIIVPDLRERLQKRFQQVAVLCHDVETDPYKYI